ncbi:PAP/fibrillin family protein [Spirulina sp. CS-785/01]|uniref:PAP/fibrillin family protein n=1 Tax=Spirulina sp. CS-785/01 TaxID=3021716 RepID=UPI00232CF1D2|nr:PAP/fibrillin family protein [Spirulina sp. CS-785/01]MDB9314249.1 PAP/fibrillin family protein [Spirulina sp. CS-785/01]
MSKKSVLLSAIAGKNRGTLANELDKINILEAITHLEDINPTDKPTQELELLDGNWRLLYTTSRELLGLNRFPVVQMGQIYQCIRTENTRVYNIAEITGVPFLEGLVCVAAHFTPTSERRVTVHFERSVLGLQRLMGYKSPHGIIQQVESGKKFPPLDFEISDREGWIDITYLDEDLRINRGNEGSVFVLVKEKGDG